MVVPARHAPALGMNRVSQDRRFNARLVDRWSRESACLVVSTGPRRAVPVLRGLFSRGV